MNELVALVRAYVARTDGAGRAGSGGSKELVAAGNLNLSFSRSSFLVPMCALCGRDPACTFLSAADRTSGAGSEPPPGGRAAPIKISELCYQCFRVAFKAIVRPLLADELHRCRLATLLSEMATATADADAAAEAAARRLQPLSDGARWACHRCTYAGNTASMSSCEVCGGPSPDMTKCTECGKHLTAALVGRPCEAATAKQRALAGAVSTRPPSSRPPPKQDLIACILGSPPGASRPSSIQQPPPPTQRGPLPTPVHCLWACERCTLVNTVDLDMCTACHSARGWECPRCTAINTSIRAPNGERSCTVCGHTSVELSAGASAQVGLDPRDVLRERQQQADTVKGRKRLEERLAKLGLVRSVQAGDGNCQFRALAHQLFGNPALHMYVRNTVATHMLRRARSQLQVLFESSDEFEKYVAGMAQSGTWGDELTLRAAADALGCHIHVISTAQQNWHLHFAPTNAEKDEMAASSSLSTTARGLMSNPSIAMGPAPALDASIMHPVRVAVAALQKELTNADDSRTGERHRRAAGNSNTSDTVGSPLLETTRNMSVDWPLDAEDGFPHVFLAYESPVHYDDVAVVGRDGKPRALGRHTVDMCRTMAAVVEAIVKEERDWIDAGAGDNGGLAARVARAASIGPEDTQMAARAASDWVDVDSDNGDHCDRQTSTSTAAASGPPSRQHTGAPESEGQVTPSRSGNQGMKLHVRLH
uniref:OTU domain-containing protein n=1 Tax=Neobodo designis TaxID=312471 RepID=A0A7S1LZW5_NEODS|mmetsp:Transcript_31672/g.97924  ORF Transcript_31672/g.97924 Transcript_31672/m.97924 type:complete len:708 (+) Transcript_31672:73-2196(+)